MRAECPVCGRAYSIPDGRLPAHRPHGQRCAGSGGLPAGVRPEVAQFVKRARAASAAIVSLAGYVAYLTPLQMEMLAESGDRTGEALRGLLDRLDAERGGRP